MRCCKECGRLVLEGDLYCKHCGVEVTKFTIDYKTAESYVRKNSQLGVGYGMKSGLFANAGPKLQAIAKIIFIIGLIIGEIIGISSIAAGADSYDGELLITIGVVLIIVSPLIAWIGSIVLYAFGELCENVNKIRCTKEGK